ncbi:MAG: hypothetical protein PHP85_13735 [Gallionella sp.]|nr:hypothetical protein [Gallionella sp.]
MPQKNSIVLFIKFPRVFRITHLKKPWGRILAASQTSCFLIFSPHPATPRRTAARVTGMASFIIGNGINFMRVTADKCGVKKRKRLPHPPRTATILPSPEFTIPEPGV